MFNKKKKTKSSFVQLFKYFILDEITFYMLYCSSVKDHSNKIENKILIVILEALFLRLENYLIEKNKNRIIKVYYCI